jgi:hypothetical protein
LREWTFGKIVRRALVYLGLALGSLTVIGLIVAFRVRTGIAISFRWIALAGYTALLFWVAIRSSREYWHRVVFWLTLAGLLAVHVLAFIAILTSYPEWRLIWFVPVVVFEAVVFQMIVNTVVRPHTRR